MIGQLKVFGVHDVRTADGKTLVATMEERTGAERVNSAYDIVCAVNHHEQLVNALLEIVLRTRQYLTGELVTFPAALIPQCEAILESAETIRHE